MVENCTDVVGLFPFMKRIQTMHKHQMEKQNRAGIIFLCEE